MKRLLAFTLSIVLLFYLGSTAVACNESQTNTYVTQILFGNDAALRESDEQTKMLLYAIYLCCEQSDNNGQDKLNLLKRNRVAGVPLLSSVNLTDAEKNELCHVKWETLTDSADAHLAKRGSLLQSTVNKVFDFGWFNNLFRKNTGKSDSFAALLYYFHLLADYIADDPEDTAVVLKEETVPSFAGEATHILHNNRPSFRLNQIIKKLNGNSCYFEGIDQLGRTGAAIAYIGPESMAAVGKRDNNKMNRAKLSGWKDEDYSDVGLTYQSSGLYNRSHLIAHQFIGEDGHENLIAGTWYLNNKGMKPIEDKVSNYIKKTQNHVVYRVTPIYKGDNQLASGVQIEVSSVEDSGTGISINTYCYNVEPGIDINYFNGESEVADQTISATNILPFAVQDVSDESPDLLYEIEKHLEVLFKNSKLKETYTEMKGKLSDIAIEARASAQVGKPSVKEYVALQKLKYEYLEVLKAYIPLLLEEEHFFRSAFNS